MGISRIVNTQFWTDDMVVDMFSPEDKLFFLYLMTNPHTTQLGIYSINKKNMAFELGYSVETISVLIDRFQNKYGVIKYSDTTHEIAIKNYLRHSIVKGGKPVEDLLLKEIASIKDRTLLQFVYENIYVHDNLNETVKKILPRLTNENENDKDNDNDNDNDNEESYHDSYNDTPHDSYHDSSKADLLSYDKVLGIAKEECPTCYNRYQRKIDSGKLDCANKLNQLLEELQGQYDYEALRKLFRHANKTYVVSPNYQQLDLLWVLSNIEKVKAIEERGDYSGGGQPNQAPTPTLSPKQVTAKTTDELMSDDALYLLEHPEEI